MWILRRTSAEETEVEVAGGLTVAEAVVLGKEVVVAADLMTTMEEEEAEVNGRAHFSSQAGYYVAQNNIADLYVGLHVQLWYQVCHLFYIDIYGRQ